MRCVHLLTALNQIHKLSTKSQPERKRHVFGFDRLAVKMSSCSCGTSVHIHYYYLHPYPPPLYERVRVVQLYMRRNHHEPAKHVQNHILSGTTCDICL